MYILFLSTSRLQFSFWSISIYSQALRPFQTQWKKSSESDSTLISNLLQPYWLARRRELAARIRIILQLCIDGGHIARAEPDVCTVSGGKRRLLSSSFARKVRLADCCGCSAMRCTRNVPIVSNMTWSASIRPKNQVPVCPAEPHQNPSR